MFTKDQIDSFQIEIVAVSTVNTDTFENLIKQVSWRMTATKDGLRGKYYVNTDLPDPGDTFIAYDDLTADDIISFLNLSAEDIEYYEDKALIEINGNLPVEVSEPVDLSSAEVRSWI